MQFQDAVIALAAGDKVARQAWGGAWICAPGLGILFMYIPDRPGIMLAPCSLTITDYQATDWVILIPKPQPKSEAPTQ